MKTLTGLFMSFGKKIYFSKTFSVQRSTHMFMVWCCRALRLTRSKLRSWLALSLCFYDELVFVVFKTCLRLNTFLYIHVFLSAGCVRPILDAKIELATNQTHFSPGVPITLSCKQGYTPVSGPRRIVCTVDGTWTNTRYMCIRRSACHTGFLSAL